jgi:hypothetical protein
MGCLKGSGYRSKGSAVATPGAVAGMILFPDIMAPDIFFKKIVLFFDPNQSLHIKNYYMKKVFLTLMAVSAIILTSCGGGGGFESDVRKTAKLSCDIQRLSTKTDDASKKELEAKQKELEEFSNKMEDKYKDVEKDPKKAAKAMEIMMEEMKNCK